MRGWMNSLNRTHSSVPQLLQLLNIPAYWMVITLHLMSFSITVLHIQAVLITWIGCVVSSTAEDFSLSDLMGNMCFWTCRSGYIPISGVQLHRCSEHVVGVVHSIPHKWDTPKTGEQSVPRPHMLHTSGRRWSGMFRWISWPSLYNLMLVNQVIQNSHVA